MTQNLVMFEVTIYLSGIENTNKDNVYVSIQLLTSQQVTIELIANFRITASDGSWNTLKFLRLSVNNPQTYNLGQLDNIMNETHRPNENGNLTIKMTGSFFNHSQHRIAICNITCQVQHKDTH